MLFSRDEVNVTNLDSPDFEARSAQAETRVGPSSSWRSCLPLEASGKTEAQRGKEVLVHLSNS